MSKKTGFGRRKRKADKAPKMPQNRRAGMSVYLRDMIANDAPKRFYRILAIGPTDLDEIDFVWRKLDWYCRNYDKITILDDCKPGKEYSRHPDNWSSFPLAALWAFKRFQTVEKFHAPFKGEKQYTKGILRQIDEQLKNADKVLAFRDFEDERTETVIERAKLFGVPVIEVRV